MPHFLWSQQFFVRRINLQKLHKVCSRGQRPYFIYKFRTSCIQQQVQTFLPRWSLQPMGLLCNHTMPIYIKKNKTEKDYNSSCRGHNIVIRIRHSHKSSFYWKGRKKRRRTDKTTNHAIGSTRNDPIQTHFHRTTLMNIYSLE